MTSSSNDPGFRHHEVLRLASRLNTLYQFLYTQAGIKPANSAVEELTKLLFLKVAATRYPDTVIQPYGSLHAIVNNEIRNNDETVVSFKKAFRIANHLLTSDAETHRAASQTIWPSDEPLRIAQANILRECIRILKDVSVGTTEVYDPIGLAFDVFLRGKYDNAGGLGTYLTPESVVDLMVLIGLELVRKTSLNDDGLIGDPCCGTGRFLVALAKHLTQPNWNRTIPYISALLFGADQSPSSVAISKVNLLACGLASPYVLNVEDSIVDPGVSRNTNRFQLILTNPPFGHNKYTSREGIQQTAKILPSVSRNTRIDPAVAFVARCIDLLRPDGIAGIILPDGIVDGPMIRSLLLHQSRLDLTLRLEGVVSLPTATFMPAGTTAKTSIVFIRKRAPSIDHQVFMANARHVGHVMKNGSISPDPHGDDLAGISEAVVSWLKGNNRDEYDNEVVFRTYRQISSLDAGSYDIGARSTRRQLSITGSRACSSFLEFRKKEKGILKPDIPFVSVLHVDELGTVNWGRAQNYRPKTPGQIARSGELIISLLNPAKFRAAVIPDRYAYILCSSEFGVFRPRVDPYAVLALLQRPIVRAQIAPLGRGTSSSRRRIRSHDVVSLLLPQVTTEELRVIGKATRDAIEMIDSARSQLSTTFTIGQV